MCIVCGEPRPANRRKYCSDRCMYARPSKPRESWDLRRSRSERNAPDRECVCGKPFKYVKKLREKFCSQECAQSVREGSVCEWRCELTWRPCVICGSSFTARTTRVTCSDACADLRYYTPASIRNPVVNHTCAECGRPFTSYMHSSRRRFCGKRCLKRISKRIRARRLHSRPFENVGLWEIWHRDGGVCQLCFRSVDFRAKGKMGPTMDHIIPVVGGGCHLRANLQLAHRSCNSKKGAGPAQLRIMLEAA